jgi:hypothetical protein
MTQRVDDAPPEDIVASVSPVPSSTSAWRTRQPGGTLVALTGHAELRHRDEETRCAGTHLTRDDHLRQAVCYVVLSGGGMERQTPDELTREDLRWRACP